MRPELRSPLTTSASRVDSIAAREQVVDIAIIGGGPVGLAAAYYAGHRDASVRIIESLEQLGGQVSAVYPEKHIFDVAGHPKVGGQALVDLCAEQGLQYGADVRLGERLSALPLWRAPPQWPEGSRFPGQRWPPAGRSPAPPTA